MREHCERFVHRQRARVGTHRDVLEFHGQTEMATYSLPTQTVQPFAVIDSCVRLNWHVLDPCGMVTSLI